ncbi:Uncharacterised protein [Escherichia coli]|nr:Uncharacterised protein [Escherichia coli]
MRFTHTGRTQQDHVLATLHERQPGQLTDDLTIDTWLEAEVELLQRFDPREAGLFSAGTPYRADAPVPFLLQRHAQELA